MHNPTHPRPLPTFRHQLANTGLALSVLLAVVLVLPFAPPTPPASAAAPHVVQSTWQEGHCQTKVTDPDEGGPVSICVRVGYRMQDDGDGLRVEDFNLDIQQGCGLLEGSGNKLTDPTRLTTYPFGSSARVSRVDMRGFGSCHEYRDLEVNGPDRNGARVTVTTVAKVNAGNDMPFTFDFDICKDNAC